MSARMAHRDDQFWASYLGVAGSEWASRGVSVRAHVGLAGFRGAWCFRHSERTVFSVPPGWVRHVTTMLASCDDDALMDEDCLRKIFGADFERTIGPAFQGCLDPNRFRNFPNSNIELVRAQHRAAFDNFRRAFDDPDWEASALSKTEEMAAYFAGAKIVAVASYRAWSRDAGDPCVLTHPDYRNRGYATRAAAAVVARALGRGKTLLYQTLESNTAAVRVATKLGYEQYARHIAVRLAADTPTA